MTKSHWYSLWPAAAVNFFYYAIFGGFISYLAIWLSQREFSSVEIGSLFASYTLIRIASGQLWAYLSDRSNNPKLFFQLGMSIAAICLVPVFFTEQKLFTFIAVTASMTFAMSVVSQLEVLSLMAAKDSAKTYNRIRLFGSVGFIVAAIFMGWLIDVWHPDAIVYFAIFVCLAGTVFAQLLDNGARLADDSEQGASFWRKCMDLGFISFMLASILLQVSFAPYVGFFTQYLANNDYLGAQVGVLFALGTFSEIFLFAFAGAVLARFHLKRLMYVCLFLTAVRWGLVADYVESALVITLTQIIHALSFGLMHSCSVYYIRHHFSAKEQNRGQFMYIGVSFGIGGAIGAALTGVTWANGVGSQLTFYWAGGAALAAALIILITPKKKFQFQQAS